MPASRIVVRVPEALGQALSAESSLQDQTVSQFVREAVIARLIYLSISRDGAAQWQRLHTAANKLSDELGASGR